MKKQTADMNTKELNKIELKSDGHDFERFNDLVRKVVSVPKKDIEAREKAEKEKKESKKKSD